MRWRCLRAHASPLCAAGIQRARLTLARVPAPGLHAVQLLIPAEAAHHTITALGEVGLLQFKDLNADKSAFQRTYANQVREGGPALAAITFLSRLGSCGARTGAPLRVWSWARQRRPW